MFFEKISVIIIMLLIGLWGMLIMLNRREKRKRYQVHKSRKAVRILTRINKNSTHRNKGKTSYISNGYGRRKRLPPACVLKAPEQLSIFDNTESSVGFFAEVLETVRNCRFDSKIFFDLSEVTMISPDAIMYLIAVIKNSRRIRANRIGCSGNTPKNDEARKMIEQSGFFSYLTPISKVENESNDKYMKILSGHEADGEQASSFCDFVQKACDTTNLGTKRLYPMIIELMTNTHQHAYDFEERQIMMANWYAFAQNTGDSVHFVFLDTGVGIPKTITKRFFERAKELISQNDAHYLKAALEGEFRSETRQAHRGKGLPGIYEDVCGGAIDRLSIISGKGKCSVGRDGVIKTQSLNQCFEGTLFTWDIIKEVQG